VLPPRSFAEVIRGRVAGEIPGDFLFNLLQCYNSPMWILYAIGASVLWGLNYVLAEQLYKNISVISSIAITTFFTFLITLLVAIHQGVFSKDIGTILDSKKLIIILVAEIIVFILADLLIAFSIIEKSATVAGLIEISYPLFIALFAYLIFRESELNISISIGGILIFIGVGIIYFFNR
jgi:drug/metabolite transporter (DMT)-like permease